MKTTQHRHDRLRLHGPHALERLSQASTTSSTCRLRAGAARRVCAPRRGEGQGVRGQLGLRVDRDRLAQAGRAEGHRRRSTSACRTTCTTRSPSPPPRPARWCSARSRSAALPPRARQMVEAVESAGVPNIGLVQLPPRAGRDARQAAHRRGPARPHLPLPRQLPAGLDDLRRPAAGRRGPVAARREGRRQRRHRRPARALHRHGPLAQRPDHRASRR